MKELLRKLKLPRATYYDRLKRNHKPDKYAKVKHFIRQEYVNSGASYGYRRMHKEAIDAGFTYSEETIRKIMTDMDLKVTLFSKHTGKYSSYKGTVGKIAPNLLKQKFNATKPLTVLHTDVTQVALYNGKWSYISVIIDEASKEVLSAVTSYSPNKKLIKATLRTAQKHIPNDLHPILHSDQGWQYQIPGYQSKLKEMGIIQSMSRKGNCHDNAPVESFFSLLKRECLNQYKIKNITELRGILNAYIEWFNHDRISMKTKGLSPISYRTQALAA
ncbi:IS3 family transposase [Lactiplantibacillus sp. WILCCON 0030]|uniref:IS3 family transposase n=1 Tax=Lactiplantibacillus brownii TaxID=3069269 RepID=A0ABU1AAX1_9LACO|nr:IS3 family transposase [Lactiplantibacillus brownii]MDQ7936612.1 IS3 family transposase [Lactiplantibacillus brownii]MDQ7936941.1 IS3 family transposase [Lactiplantibacillus brownii]MDQ7938114.1 IS3 family transposase [Lactiplantibacillus brownii]MDQ7938507.1 IS3 family transposase [Lactiplantibacillus brownii]